MLIGQVLERTKIDPVEVEIFLSYLLDKDRSFVKAFPEFKLGKRQTTKLKGFIKRRIKHEPLAYILGYKEFCGLNFKVDPRVMIPRPETEGLVAEVIAHVYARPNRSLRNPPDNRGQYSRALRPLRGLRNRTSHLEHYQLTIVDVGTGSGNIAISLAKAIPFAKIFAVEKTATALRVAKENIRNHQVEGNVELIKGNLLEPIGEPVDIIVANLPYIPASRFPSLEPEISKWEPRIALDGGSDGLELYRSLFQQAPKVLKPSGMLFYELDGQTYKTVN